MKRPWAPMRGGWLVVIKVQEKPMGGDIQSTTDRGPIVEVSV